MGKEFLTEQIISTQERNPGLHILMPGDLTSEETANKIIDLLQAMYVEHGITKNREKLIDAIGTGEVLTWFAKKDSKFVATASLVKQSDGAWELGRAVSLDRGNGIGKRVILEALKFHLENHPNKPLTAEVRAAADFEGVPSGLATQKIFFGLIDKILPLTPYAVAPLFAHGDPLRNEQFILSATDIKPSKTISEKLSESINGRSKIGIIPRLHVIQTVPFRLVLPNNEGGAASDVVAESANFQGCSLFPVEVTDHNMPLIGMLSANPNMVLCGVDRILGKEGKPVVLIATIGFNDKSEKEPTTRLAPTHVSEELPIRQREDVRKIVNKFTQIYFSANKNHKEDEWKR